MSEFLYHHANFARWGILYLALGAGFSVAWSWRFRRLLRRGIEPAELRWEAWSGVVAGVGWLLILALIALQSYSSVTMTGVESIAIADEISPELTETVAYWQGLIFRPAGVAIAGALMLLMINSVWSGALGALRSREVGR